MLHNSSAVPVLMTAKWFLLPVSMALDKSSADRLSLPGGLCILQAC